MRAQPAAGFEWVDTSSGLALRCAPLQRFADHLFTTRGWALGSSIESNDGHAAGWAEVAGALHLEPARLHRVRQVHGAAVAVVHPDAMLRVDAAAHAHTSSYSGALPRAHTVSHTAAASRQIEADILVTGDRDAAVAIQTADCVPLLVADERTGAVAAAHAGWRGLAARVPQVAVAAMADAFGSRPADLLVAVGPSISAERYEVDRQVRDRFEAAGFGQERLRAWFPAETRPDHWLFDGWQSARDQLEAVGVPAERLYVAQLCTATHPDLLCSYRRDGKRAGRMAAAITRGPLRR